MPRALLLAAALLAAVAVAVVSAAKPGNYWEADSSNHIYTSAHEHNGMMRETPIGQLSTAYFERFKATMQEAGHWDDIEAATDHEADPFEAYSCEHEKHFVAKGGHAKLQQRLAERSKAVAADAAADADAQHREARQSGSFGPIRIFVDDSRLAQGADTDYTCYVAGDTYIDPGSGVRRPCRPQDVLTPQMSSFFLNTMVPQLLEIAELSLSVDQSRGPISPSGQCADFVDIPAGPFDNFDYVVMVTARPMYSDSGSTSTVAVALACDFDGRGRPTAGYITFNTQQFQDLPNNDRKLQSLVRVGFHELTHALGFSQGLYSEYRDSRTSSFNTWPSGVIPAVRDTPWGSRLFVETPRVQAFALGHFGCDTISGFGLESEGGSGTAGSHWKQRLSGNEYMGGFISPAMVVSNLSLAFFEDMGWYVANYSMGENLLWLRGKGCAAATQRCSSSTWPYWCDTALEIGCTADRLVKGSCNLVSYSSLDPKFQYDGLPQNEGGNLATADYCPFYVPEPGTRCDDPSNNGQGVNSKGENFGQSGKCFETDGTSASLPSGGGSLVSNVGCYQTVCDRGAQTYEVVAWGETKSCPEGSTVQFDDPTLPLGGGVGIKCAPYAEVCESSGICVSVEDGCIDKTNDDSINWLGLTKSPLEFWLVIGAILICVIIVVCLVLCCCCDVTKLFCGCGKKSQSMQRGNPRAVRRGPPMARNIGMASRTVRGRPPPTAGPSGGL